MILEKIKSVYYNIIICIKLSILCYISLKPKNIDKKFFNKLNKSLNKIK